MVLAAGAMLAAGIGATLIAGRLKLPGLVLFLGLGMVVGSDGLGWVAFDNYKLARTIGIIALALILFEGGLTTGFRSRSSARSRPPASRESRPSCCSASRRSSRSWSARSWPAPTAPRSSPCCEARRCAGDWPRRSRANPA
jgi:hypothetical protein